MGYLNIACCKTQAGSFVTTSINHQQIIPSDLAFMRLDQVSAQMFPQYSRTRLQGWIRSGELTVDGELRRPKDKVSGGEEIEIDASLAELDLRPEPIPLEVVFEDDSVIVVNKPVGLVVHPGAGNPSGTLLNGLLHFDGRLARVPRAGIVHRLDKGTSGLLVVARTIESQNSLVQQLQAREVSRIYQAVVYGILRGSGKIEAAIGRHPVNRLRMAVTPSGKEAITHYRVLKGFFGHTLLELALETGRTHQIRVHLEKIGYPIIGDTTYGGGFRMPKERDEGLAMQLRSMTRQALHAVTLSFAHPATGARVSFQSDLPTDLTELLAALECFG